MTRIRLAATVLNQLPLDWDGNQARIRAVLAQARAAGAGLVCLPELCISGYGCEDAFHGPDVVVQAERVLGELLPDTAGLVVAIGLPWLHQRSLFNTVALIADGRILGMVAKRHLAGDGIHYEPRWFKPWQEGVVSTTHCLGQELPLGDLLFDLGGVRIGFEICEDAWVASRPGGRLAAHGVDLILNPSASHAALGKLPVRQRFVTEGSRAFSCAYVYANLLGNEAGRAIYDGGAMIAASGRLLAQGRRLHIAEHDLVAATIDVATARLVQARNASFRPALVEHPGLVRADYKWPQTPVLAEAEPTVEAWESSPHLAEEEFTRMEVLALFDYLRKAKAQGFVVSFSGGCDSAAVVALVGLMVRAALAELGPEGFRRQLAHVRNLPASNDPALLTQHLLTTCYQGSANSGETTRAAAASIAAALGARHLDLDIAPLVEGYIATIAQAIGRRPTWQQDDIALQNIQARVRAPSIWLIANLEDKLLLATSNRSEAAVGYATMDGDTCGGLSPLAGIDKEFLRRWLSWLAEHGPVALGSIPALVAVTRQDSTPELRPAEAEQRSEEDLMPFDVLDRIERLSIRDKLAPAAILPRLQVDFPDHAEADLRRWLQRFVGLWCRNQWKRERLAPAFHLDDENLDPKTWCRFPILSGGFARELRDLG